MTGGASTVKVWIGLVVLATLLAQAAAPAQIFTPPVNPFEVRSARNPGQRIDRLRIGTYWAQWELSSYRSSGATVRQDADASPLLTVDYAVSHNLSFGGWWNQLTGDDHQSGRSDLPRKVADFDATFWDVHGTYYLPERWARGWSVQAGLSSFRANVNVVRELGGASLTATHRSGNFWVAKTQQLGGRSKHPVSLFGSFGYFTAPGFGAKNLILGGSVDLSRHFNVTGSVWLNDLDSLSVRTTVGLVGRF